MLSLPFCWKLFVLFVAAICAVQKSVVTESKVAMPGTFVFELAMTWLFWT